VVLYGALVFPETTSTGDVDGHVVVADPLTEQDKAGIRRLHAALESKHAPLANDLDLWYLLRKDTEGSAPPQHQLDPGRCDQSWALHRAHIRAGRCLVLYGPDPRKSYPAPTWEEIEAALYGELAYVQRNLDEYPAYCVLNLCRLAYSFCTHDVVISKASAAAWAWEAYPARRPLIEAARRSYAQEATEQDQALLRSEVGAMLRWVVEGT
jgi:hypothetical protein